MNMANIEHFVSFSPNKEDNIEDNTLDRRTFVESRRQKLDIMLFLEENGSKEPVLLLNIMKYTTSLDKKLSKQERIKNIVKYFSEGDGKHTYLTAKNIQHEIKTLTQLGFKY